MNPILAILQQPSFWAGALVTATPLLFGVLGTVVCERAGVRNYGIEGIFIAGALAGFATLHFYANPWIGIGMAAAVGLALGLAHGVLTGPFGLSQPLIGVAVTLIAANLSAVAFRLVMPEAGAPAAAAGFAPINPDLLERLPYIGLGLGQFLTRMTPLTYLAVIALILVSYVLWRTPLGVALRACGDNPSALAAQGRSVHAMRVGADAAGAALMGIGGACLTLAGSRIFSVDMVNGRGWLCLALVICARWRLSVAFPVTLLVGALDAYQVELRHRLVSIPSLDLLPILPYALVIFACALFARRHYPPPALLVPYRNGSRDRES